MQMSIAGILAILQQRGSLRSESVHTEACMGTHATQFFIANHDIFDFLQIPKNL